MKCGIIDVGSNTIRLSIYHWEGKRFKLLMNKKEMAGLAGYIHKGVLSDEGVQVACQVLGSLKALTDNLEIREVRAFATASLRNIINTGEAVDAIHTATGLDVEVLSGTDEASYSFLGATVGGGAPETGLLADIGGGSTELVAYRDGEIVSECSLPIGSLSLYTKYVGGLLPTRTERRAMRDRVLEELDRARTAGISCAHLTGVGGTIRAAGKLCAAASGDARDLSAEEIRALYKELKKGDLDIMHQLLRVVPDRVHTILPGLTILKAVIKRYGIESVTVSGYGVREGYLLDRVMGVKGHG